MFSQATADRLGVETGDIVEISSRDRKLEAPAMIVPGHADDAVTLPLGYGRLHTGHVGLAVGFNAGELRASDAPWFDRGATVTNTGRHHRLAITQDHWTMSPDGREIPPPAVEAPLAEVLNSGSMFHEELESRRGPLPEVFKPVDYSEPAVQVGDGDRPQQVHRLQRLRGRLPVGEQHPRRRQGQRLAQPRDALAPDRPLLQRPGRRPRR